ncbi:MAG: hypothetical protein SHS37scaffold296_37 [Burkholderiales phage 68_11]|jgi:hypothetical protein|nr:MAG: hypothetical protein SHS37scaffold296_37 [Burkholderiales phage 68_11]
MNALDAALVLARRYPGGAAALGARMGKSNLADELNPNLPRSKLGLEDAVTMQLLSGRFDILYAMALECRHFPPVPMPEQVDGDAPCLQTLAAMAREFGDVIAEVSKDLADNQVTDNELAAATQKWALLVAEGQRLMSQMTAMNAALRARAEGIDAAAR